MNKVKKLLLVFGTRPEAIKMAPLVKKLQDRSDQFETIVCVTGQHREMLDQVSLLFDIVPDFDLDIMTHNQDLYDVTSRVLMGMRDVLKNVRPDLLLVHGDTTTSTASALAAYYQHIPVGHVEAGLRTGDIYSPWPEELNRQITGRIATYHFAPTKISKENLLREGVNADQIVVTGNTVIDSLFMILNKIHEVPSLESDIIASLLSSHYDISRLNDNKKLVLITGHRRENFGDGFIEICKGIKELSHLYPNVDFVYPMHLNPNVRNPIEDVFGNSIIDNIYFIEPLDYLPFVYLMSKSYLVITDSGGIQEEAPALGKPVLVMRDTTERPEALSAGTVKLVGTDKNKIIMEASRLLNDVDYYASMSSSVNPYGDGSACNRILDVLSSV